MIFHTSGIQGQAKAVKATSRCCRFDSLISPRRSARSRTRKRRRHRRLLLLFVIAILASPRRQPCGWVLAVMTLASVSVAAAAGFSHCSRSSAKSAAVAYRSDARFDNAFKQMRSNSAGMVSTSSLGGRGSRDSTRCSGSCMVLPRNGFLPVSNSYWLALFVLNSLRGPGYLRVRFQGIAQPRAGTSAVSGSLP